jgi:hypothetical protein
MAALPSLEAFGATLAARAAAALPERTFRVDAEHGLLVVEGEREVSLHEPYDTLEDTLGDAPPPDDAAIEAAVDDLAEELILFLTGDVAGRWEQVAEAVYAQLFHRGERELAIRLGRLPPHEAEAPHMPIHAALGLQLIVETLFGPLVLHLDTLEALGVDFEVALRKAQENLSELGLTPSREETAGLWVFESDEGYGSARLLCADAALDPFDTTLAFAPTQDLFFLVDGSDEEALVRLSELAPDVAPPTGLLCPTLMARAEGTWQPVALPATHPAADALARFAAEATVDLYRRQGDALREALEEGVAQGDPPAEVVQPSVGTDGDGLACLTCQLTPKTPVLLPVVDTVALVGFGDDRELPFAELLERCASALHDLETQPPRVVLDGPLRELLDMPTAPEAPPTPTPQAEVTATASAPRGSARLAAAAGGLLLGALVLLLLLQLTGACD